MVLISTIRSITNIRIHPYFNKTAVAVVVIAAAAAAQQHSSTAARQHASTLAVEPHSDWAGLRGYIVGINSLMNSSFQPQHLEQYSVSLEATLASLFP